MNANRTTPSTDLVQMRTAYDPKTSEQRWYEEWVRRGYFHATPNSGREPFCVVIPPPNVTGALHAGHALNGTIQDVIVRRKRMQGFETLWLPGTDHAGIATQVVVERELAKEGIDRRELGREAFIQRVWQWKEQYGNTIVEQFKALGSSCDWDRLRFTMDEGLARAVRVAFVRMYEDGLIYRGERIINWCPRDTTALSDSEVEYEDVEGELVTFRYNLADGSGHIDVATTRTETILGDTGVAVHPEDDRYRHLVGKRVVHPFRGEEIPIVADEAVDRDFGTGAVKITPAHDPLDFEIAQRHGLPPLNILTAEGNISAAAPEGFIGLDRYEGRALVLERLRGRGLVVKEERPYLHAVGHCYRCHTEIEPWLSGKQWFVAVDRLKGPARQVVEDGRIRFSPERWANPYLQWLDNLRDWNISRQLWWGHQIPVWYCANGHEFAAIDDPDACEECGSGEIEQDPDVLDTWFSSQLWPFSTLGWPDDTEDLRFFYPTSVLVTGYEILYLWVARMIMSGLYFLDDIPFHEVVITGLVRDAHGRPMHKSLGNVINPLDLIQNYGADALRFGLMRLATGGQDVPLSEEVIESGRRFGNKIWNASRLVFSARDGATGTPELPSKETWTLPDRWLLSRHQACLEQVDEALDRYAFSDAAQALYGFFWSEFCDWALEAAKSRLYEGTEEQRRAQASLLAWVLERTLRMLHPVMPFVTEEIWQRFDAGPSIVVAPWPEQHRDHRDEQAEIDFGFAEEVISAVRRFRKAHGLKDSMSLAVRIQPTPAQRGVLDSLRVEIQRLANVSTLEVADGPVDATGSARLVADGAQLVIPLAGVLDLDVERQRLTKRLTAVQTDIARAEGKLGNDAFVSKAPPEIVAKEQDRLRALKDEAATLSAQLEELS
ncbi:MAG TPA: valine--tRNA ligase [Actinomycetota bacterium]|nr:valine--tRNA ligase [Actinomycetota bacterium]